MQKIIMMLLMVFTVLTIVPIVEAQNTGVELKSFKFDFITDTNGIVTYNLTLNEPGYYEVKAKYKNVEDTEWIDLQPDEFNISENDTPYEYTYERGVNVELNENYEINLNVENIEEDEFISFFDTFQTADDDILNWSFERNQENIFLLFLLTLILLGMWFIGIIHGAEHFVMFSVVMLFTISFILLNNEWGLFVFLFYMLKSLILSMGYFKN